MPLVSIIIPTYNRPMLLERAVESVLMQKFKDYEVIVIDDCSTKDNSELNEIAVYNKTCHHDQYKVTYHRNDKNEGLPATRNKGILNSSGKYICYLDDDDMLYPNHLELLSSVLENSDYKVVYSDSMQARCSFTPAGEINEITKDLIWSYDFDKVRLFVENYIPVLCVMHDRECLRVGTFDTELPCLEDWDMWIRMSNIYEFLHLPIVTSQYTVRVGNIIPGVSSITTDMGNFHKYIPVIYDKHRNQCKYNDFVVTRQKAILDLIMKG